jgi:eukaryotic-like serine/threonine-protein kinase
VDAESPSPPDPRIGHLLQGRYRILSKLASGAMGVVYKGERVQLARPVAVKFLHPWIAAQKAFLTRFENEAKAMSRLQHPNCVSVIDFGVDGSPYLVMDFVTGGTLREVMQAGPVAIERVFKIAQQLLAGMAHAHAQGIVHRDLKPENLILSGEEGIEEHLRILDFGLAKLRDGPAMTAGFAVGTPSYMSPEQSGGQGTVDARSDLYAVGVLLFEILAGRKPFQSENVGELIFMHRESPPPLLREAAPAAGYSPALEAAIGRALAKLPEDRFQSASDFAAALAATPDAQGGARPSAGPTPKPEPKRPVPAKTTVDTVSAVRRRLGADVPADLPAATSAPRRTTWMILGGFVLVVLVALSIGRGLGRKVGTVGTPAGPAGVASASAPVAAPSSPAPAGTAPSAHAPAPAPGSESPQIEQARQLVAAGQSQQAIQVLEQLRAEKSNDADAPYMLATIYFDQHRWSEGLAAAQAAIHSNPEFKTDGDLVRGAIRSLSNDRVYERSQAFLRGLGGAATPFVKEAAHRDPNPKVRQRAAELLEGGGRSSGGSWGGSRQASSSSLFRR